MNECIKKIVIVGGGTAGWMAATGLNHFLKDKGISISLIESSDIGTIGVGEATLPAIRDFNQAIGIDEIDFIRSTQATFKLGIKFEDWHKTGEAFFHPFSGYGSPLNGVGFHHYINKLNGAGQARQLSDYSLPAQMAKLNNFAQPQTPPSNALADYHYAFHFDAIRYAGYLKNIALNKGVSLLTNTVTKTNIDKHNGYIKSLSLDNQKTIEADLFIDCSGFKGLLIEEALHTGYDDWSEWLLCNSAITIQSTAMESPTPFTQSKALAAGWQWQIPLQGRTGNGYVYCDKYVSDVEATDALIKNVNLEPISKPKILKFTTGRRKLFWNKNCVALGLANGFMEPLESTSISMVQTGIFRLLQFFPHKGFNDADRGEANRLSQNEAERIRDFLILHYKASKRTDTEFWKDVQTMNIPSSLKHKIEVFKSRGHIINHEGESFTDASWLTMYDGFNIHPDQHDIRADAISSDQLIRIISEMQQSIKQAASSAMSHQDFIKAHCSI